ncbi:MAG: sensor histidine kinase [Bacteroidota bacterium]
MGEKKRSVWGLLYKYKAHHVLFWVFYFVFWMSLYSKYYGSFIGLLLITGLYAVFNAAAYYTTAYYLFPKYFYKRRYGLFFGTFTVLVLLLSTILAICIYFLFRKYSPEVDADIFGVFQLALMSVGTMVGLMCGVKLLVEKIRSDNVAKKLEQDRLESELQYLKAQVNPHFLFNAINSVYFLIKKDPHRAAETLIKLSDLLRFQLYDCSGEKIAIEKELDYLKNFIALEKVRKGEKVKVEMNANGNLSGFQVAPFLMIPFLENAFKYVSNSNATENLIKVTFHREENRFTADFQNTTDNIIKHDVGGIGLKNVKRRLELIYPGKHQLQIQDRPGLYSVSLSLEIA